MANKTNFNQLALVWRGQSGHLYLSPFDKGNADYTSVFTQKLPDTLVDNNEDEILKFITSDGILYNNITFIFDI